MFLVLVDRYSSWITVARAYRGSASELVTLTRQFFVSHGAAEEIVTDGGRQFISEEFAVFLKGWGVRHHITSAYHPHSNLRAESAVKSAKRILAENVGPNGSLDNDRVSQALLQHRNTPLRGLELSPSQIIFGRNLRDTLPCCTKGVLPRQEWVRILDAREKVLSKKHLLSQEKWSKGVRDLGPLAIGQPVMVQNRHGPKSKKWELSGTVVENVGFDSYMVRLDGSGRVSKRRRQFLKAIVPFENPDLDNDDENSPEEGKSRRSSPRLRTARGEGDNGCSN